MAKKLIISAILFAVLLGGCTDMNILTQSNESLRDEILEHLSQKYGREFTAIAMDRGSSVAFTCFPTGGDPKADLVRVIRRRDRDSGIIEIKDTYFGILIREEVEAEVTALLSGIDIPLHVRYSSDIFYFDNSFDGTKNFEDFMSWSSTGNNLWGFDICVVVSLDNLDDAESYANEVFDIISSSHFHGLISIIVLPTEGFSKLTRTNLNDLVADYNSQTMTISKNIK